MSLRNGPFSDLRTGAFSVLPYKDVRHALYEAHRAASKQSYNRTASEISEALRDLEKDASRIPNPSSVSVKDLSAIAALYQVDALGGLIKVKAAAD